MQRPLEKTFLYNQCGGDQVWHNQSLKGVRAWSNGATVLANPRKEEGDSAISFSQRLAVMGRGHSLKSDEVVMDNSQVVVATSQKSREAVGCQPIQL